MHGDHGGDDVDAFVTLSSADGLRAEDPAGRHLEDQLERHVVALRHQRHFVIGKDQHAVTGDASRFRRFFAESAHGRILIEHADAG